jgi:alkylation response protein AidB-like acyl-CoA dehydrogenase
MSASNSCVLGRKELEAWENEISKNIYRNDLDFRHTVAFHLPGHKLDKALEAFAEIVIHEVEPLVAENNRPENLPQIAHYDGIGNRMERIVHHPSYAAAGDLIYGSGMLEMMRKKGGLAKGLMFFFLSSQVGEAGHNCPIACSYGIMRVLQKVPDFPNKSFYLKKLAEPSYASNYTGAQFVTEVQGGSDVGNNAVRAVRDRSGHWRISGEKWFCSNADAELILVTARFNPKIAGTKGLGLFLVPAVLDSGEGNPFIFRRLKDKLGTRSLATAEIDFQEAFAFPVGKPEEGFKLLMENVLHASRLFNSVTVLAMARRAFHIAFAYARCRKAFGKPIIQFPLIQENLARIKAENSALLASIFATVALQDRLDLKKSEDDQTKLLLRLLANLNKYLSALWTVEHIHHSLDVLAGNGAIETFSSIPLLLRDSIICENWEGTHNVLRMQIYKDILRYEIDQIFFNYLQKLLQKIKHPSRKALDAKFKELLLEMKEFKKAPPDLQMLLIKSCLDGMGVLLAASHLLLEAIDQQKRGSMSKMHCFHYFVLLHLSKEKPPPQQLLGIIQAVL